MLRDVVSPIVTITVPARSGIVTVTVSWSGNDGAGAGVDTYDVQFRVDGGDWTTWLTNTTQTQAEYVGEYGHAYAFRARATDNV